MQDITCQTPTLGQWQNYNYNTITDKQEKDEKGTKNWETVQITRRYKKDERIDEKLIILDCKLWNKRIELH